MSASWRVSEVFAANLVHARHHAGLSQEALGLAAGLHRTEISLLERGTRIPRIDTLVKLAGGLEVPLECPLLKGIRWSHATVSAGGFEFSAEDVSADREHPDA